MRQTNGTTLRFLALGPFRHRGKPGSSVRTPICHIVPVSRAYRGGEEGERVGGERRGGRRGGRGKGKKALVTLAARVLLDAMNSSRVCVVMFQRPLTLILLQKYRDTNGRRIVIQIGGVYTTFGQKEGMLLQKYRDRNWRCIAILFTSIRVRGRFGSPEKCHSSSPLVHQWGVPESKACSKSSCVQSAPSDTKLVQNNSLRNIIRNSEAVLCRNLRERRKLLILDFLRRSTLAT